MNDNCIFCKILKGEIPSAKIYEDEYTYAFLDISGDFYGHTLVIPKQHYKNVLDCETAYLNAVVNAVQTISNHYVNNCGFSGVNVFNNSGESAEQSVMHLHFHIIPRKSNDGVNSWPLFEGAKEELAKMHEVLKIK